MNRDPVTLPRVGLVHYFEAPKFVKVSSASCRDFGIVGSGCFVKYVETDSRHTKDAW